MTVSCDQTYSQDILNISAWSDSGCSAIAVDIVATKETVGSMAKTAVAAVGIVADTGSWRLSYHSLKQEAEEELLALLAR